MLHSVPGWRVAILSGLLLIASVGGLAVPSRAASFRVLFSEDFESGVWNPDLVAYDENPASGEDYWGLTRAAAASGIFSAAPAALGSNSRDGWPNIFYDEGTFAWIIRYDDNMSASMDLEIGPGDGYLSRRLAFSYSAYTEPWTVDVLSVLALVEGAWRVLWTQPVTNTGSSFLPVELAIPSNATWISFHFYSDDAESDYPGVFVDDIVVSGARSEWLLPIGHPSGFRLPIPEEWTFELNATVGNTTVDLFAEGLWEGIPANVFVDTEVNATAREDESFLRRIFDEFQSDLQRISPEGVRVDGPTFRQVANHAAAAFEVHYNAMPVVQQGVFVVSEEHGRWWALVLTTLGEPTESARALFEAMLDGFEITLHSVSGGPSLFVVRSVLIGLGASAVVAAFVVHLLQRPRRKGGG